MNTAKQRRTVVVDLYTRCCLTALAALLTVMVIGLWATSPTSPGEARAAPVPATEGIGNPSAQRAAIHTAIQTTNQKLEQLLKLLQSGKVKVIVAKEEVQDAPPKVEQNVR